jgi:hypothetical protein
VYRSAEGWIGRHQQCQLEPKRLENALDFRAHLSAQHGVHFLVDKRRAGLPQEVSGGGRSFGCLRWSTRARVRVDAYQFRRGVDSVAQEYFGFQTAALSDGPEFGRAGQVISNNANHVAELLPQKNNPAKLDGTAISR